MIAPLLALALLVQTPGRGTPPDSAPDPLAIRAATGVAPDTVTVGDLFRAFLAVRHAPGARVRVQPLPTTDSLQLLDSVRTVRADSAGVAVAYPLVAWAATDSLRAVAVVEVSSSTGARRTYHVPLRLPVVASVLPAEGEVQPRPPRGLLPALRADRFPWWILLVALAVASGVALLVWWWRRPRAAPRIDPREEALAALRALPPPDPADPRSVTEHYAGASRVLRRYLARTHETWGEELTTRELMARLSANRTPRVDADGVRALLAQADPVKFAGVQPAAERAVRFRDELRAWIEANPPRTRERREAA